jgi:hypothetical protein
MCPMVFEKDVVAPQLFMLFRRLAIEHFHSEVTLNNHMIDTSDKRATRAKVIEISQFLGNINESFNLLRASL